MPFCFYALLMAITCENTIVMRCRNQKHELKSAGICLECLLLARQRAQAKRETKEFLQRKERRLFLLSAGDFNLPMNFWEKVKKTQDCWLWTGARCPTGYGTFSVKRKTFYAHRLMCEAVHGEIPKGYQVDHICKNPSCVYPLHLQAVTPAENTYRSNSLSSINLLKTHCIRGHKFTFENTYIYPSTGKRACIACRKLRCATLFYKNKRHQYYKKAKAKRSILAGQMEKEPHVSRPGNEGGL